jgi:Ankyrin repeats (3 copies)
MAENRLLAALQNEEQPREVIHNILHSASRKTSLRLLRERVGPDGWLPLHYAVASNNSRADAQQQQLDVVRLLTEGWDFALYEKTQTDGGVPLHLAVQHKSPVEVVHYLVDRRPDTLHIRDKRGRIPLHIAVEDSRASVGVVELLVRKGGPRALLARNLEGGLPLLLDSILFTIGIQVRTGDP